MPRGERNRDMGAGSTGGKQISEPTPKQWMRRALKAGSKLETIKKLRQFDAKNELELARENATLRVALREIQDASNWAYGAIAAKLETSK